MRSPVVRKWPMVAGHRRRGHGRGEHAIRCSQGGDNVILTGWGVGETHWGCLAEKARLKGDWLVKLPAGMTTRQAMAIGTAGFTAMLCVMELEAHGRAPRIGRDPRHRRLGRRGQRGHRASSPGWATASSPRPAALNESRLPQGAGRGRGDRPQGRSRSPGKPLQKERWAGVRRFGRQPHARQCLRADEAKRRRHRVRPGAGHGPARRRSRRSSCAA